MNAKHLLVAALVLPFSLAACDQGANPPSESTAVTETQSFEPLKPSVVLSNTEHYAAVRLKSSGHRPQASNVSLTGDVTLQLAQPAILDRPFKLVLSPNENDKAAGQVTLAKGTVAQGERQLVLTPKASAEVLTPKASAEVLQLLKAHPDAAHLLFIGENDALGEGDRLDFNVTITLK